MCLDNNQCGVLIMVTAVFGAGVSLKEGGMWCTNNGNGSISTKQTWKGVSLSLMSLERLLNVTLSPFHRNQIHNRFFSTIVKL